MDAAELQPIALAEGLTRYSLPEGLTALVVESVSAVPSALSLLEESMQDRCVAIDLEWRHARNGRPGLVALIQARSGLAVYVRLVLPVERCCRLLRQQLRVDPAVQVWLQGRQPTVIQSYARYPSFLGGRRYPPAAQCCCCARAAWRTVCRPRCTLSCGGPTSPWWASAGTSATSRRCSIPSGKGAAGRCRQLCHELCRELWRCSGLASFCW